MKNKNIVFGLLFIASTFSASVHSTEDNYFMGAGKKLAVGFVNAVTAGVELPKNIYLSTTQADLAYLPITPFFGAINGVGDTVGRSLAGMVDMVTFPIPTQNLVSPGFVWENFDLRTTLGPQQAAR